MNSAPSSSSILFKRILFFSLAVAACGPANAAFFQIQENSVSQLGNANAGGAAASEDASAVWYNPAGLTRLSGSQLVLAGHYIDPSAKFAKTSATLSSTFGGTAISGSNGGDAGESAFVPNFYYTNSLNDRLTFGLGVNAPFGLATNYDDNWVGRYHADRSEIKTINVNPALGYRIGNQLSVGGGLNVQRIEAELTNKIDYGSICAAAAVGACTAPGALDGSAALTGSDTSFGYNLGVLWELNPNNRVGLAYRSEISHKVEGYSRVTAPTPTAAAAAAAAAGISNSAAQAYITVPETISLSTFHQLTPQWALMGDITRTRWSRLPELRIDFLDNTQSDSVITLGLEDVNRYSIGATYTPGGAWSYRIGVALDQTPTPSPELRSARVPDTDRLWLALGANYRMSKAASLDVAFVRVEGDDSEINKSAGTSSANENFLRGNLRGTYEASVNILSLQANWSF